jgi:hypothetical protein
MFKWLFRKKKDIRVMDDNNAKTINTIPRDVLAKVKIPRKFEIFVEEYTESDIGCQAGWRPVAIDSKLGGNGGNPVITVNSQEDLQEKQNFYKTVGQRFTIVREIDPPSVDDIRKAAIAQGLMKADSISKPPEQNTGAKPTGAESVCDEAEPAREPQEKRSTRYYKVGDVEIKEEGGRLYQKQWLRLSPAEASNFRIVSDSSNKIVSMKGKHIEARKWLAVEHVSGDQVNSEDIINA